MKQAMTKLTLAACIVGLAACSTNTQNQNTAIGAGTGAVAGGLLGSLASGAGSGWVIAAGAVVGAVVGGVIGHSMDHSDTNHIDTALNNNAVNQPSKWQNDKTGNSYQVTPTTGFITYKGNPNCRRYVAQAQHNGKTSTTKGLACRVDNGTWKQIR